MNVEEAVRDRGSGCVMVKSSGRSMPVDVVREFRTRNEQSMSRFQSGICLVLEDWRTMA